MDRPSKESVGGNSSPDSRDLQWEGEGLGTGDLLRRIRNAEEVAQVSDLRSRLPNLIEAGLAQAVSPETLVGYISAVGDAVVLRFVELALEAAGPPPARFSFLVLGSAGRNEQTLVTDQDNALLLEDPRSGEETRTREYFSALGEKLCDWLDRAGYRFCLGEVMARNPLWCLPASRWKSHFEDWIFSIEPELQVRFGTFFDFRGLCGGEDLVTDLRDHVFRLLRASRGFFRHLGETALRYRIPLRFWGNVRVERKGPHRGMLNLKKALEPFVFIIRLYAFAHGLEEVNTFGRIRRLAEVGVWGPSKRDELLLAYSALLRLRLDREVAALIAGETHEGPWISVKTLGVIQQRRLRAALNTLKNLQKGLRLSEL